MKTERKQIAIETLTPVHIGSGETLRENFDYIIKRDGKYNYVYVLDMKEIVNRLQKKGSNVVNIFVNTLSMGRNIKNDFLEKYLANDNIEDYSQRMIYLPYNRANELKEHIHDGFGLPYIPGSSLKGAIRTAILTHLIKKENIRPNDIRPKSKIVQQTLSFTNTKINDEDKTDNYMRLFQVSDAYFEQDGMDALLMTILNIKGNGVMDSEKSQLVEAITPKEQSSLVMKITDTNNFPFHSIEELFSTINNHTKSILSEDKKFWSDYDDTDSVKKYREACFNIIEEIDSLDNKSCILRVGNSNGWKFMTGNWVREKNSNIHNNENEWQTWIIENTIRNSKYKGCPFPKSRRINKTQDGINLLGFVKLTIEE